MTNTLCLECVHISIMTGKLLGLRAISTNTLTNLFCQKMQRSKVPIICQKCYSWAMLNGFRKNNAPALQRNSDLLGSRALQPGEVPNIVDRYFRFQAHGELINQRHLKNLILICERNPHCTFSLWTKRKDIVRKVFAKAEKPANLVLIYSNPKVSTIMAKPPKGFHKTFNNVLEHEDTERQNCTGQKCLDCLLCYKLDTTDTIVEKVKKY